MARRVFFSFEFSHDVWRANVVRNSWVTQGREAAGFVDAAQFEEVKAGGDMAVKKWIRGQLHGTSVTVVLVGSHTCFSKFVKYEIEQSRKRRNGLLGIDISEIGDRNGAASYCCGQMPAGYSFYHWQRDDGRNNMGWWVELAAVNAGR